MRVRVKREENKEKESEKLDHLSRVSKIKVSGFECKHFR